MRESAAAGRPAGNREVVGSNAGEVRDGETVGNCDGETHRDDAGEGQECTAFYLPKEGLANITNGCFVHLPNQAFGLRHLRNEAGVLELWASRYRSSAREWRAGRAWGAAACRHEQRRAQAACRV